MYVLLLRVLLLSRKSATDSSQRSSQIYVIPKEFALCVLQKYFFFLVEKCDA